LWDLAFFHRLLSSFFSSNPFSIPPSCQRLSITFCPADLLLASLCTQPDFFWCPNHNSLMVLINFSGCQSSTHGPLLRELFRSRYVRLFFPLVTPVSSFFLFFCQNSAQRNTTLVFPLLFPSSLFFFFFLCFLSLCVNQLASIFVSWQRITFFSSLF